MLTEETNDELFDRIESVIYILGDRIPLDDLRKKIDDLLMDAISDIEMERKPAG